MRAAILLISSVMIPSVCFAHSGTMLRAAANYLPLIAPILLGGIALAKNILSGILGRHDTKDHE